MDEQPINVRAFLKHLTECGLYYVFVVDGVEWEYLIVSVAHRYFSPFTDDHSEFGVVLHGGPKVFYLKRSRVSLGDLARTLGLGQGFLEKSEAIRLLPLAGADEAKLPKPTVGYWGTA